MKPAAPRPDGRLPRLRRLIVALVILVAGCSSSAPLEGPDSPPTATGTAIVSTPDTPDGTTRKSDGGQVTAVVTWAGPDAGLVFEVKLDTHSVDLDALDLTDVIVRNDRGQELAPTPWTAPSGGHHRVGSLAFAGDAAAFLADAAWIELVLVGIGDVPERVLRWEIGG